MDSQPQGPQLNIELSEETAEGVYSNLVMISHGAEEFVLDFIRVMPGVPKGRVKSRVVVSPPHAKRLIAALADNVRRYEAQFGEIAEGHAAPHVQFSPAGGEA